MKYVLNTGRYSLTFSLVGENGIARKLEFDRQRFYKDTGNLATSGITEVDDKDYKELEKLKDFKRLFEENVFTLTDKPVSVQESQAQLKQKDEEISQLKKELEENKNADVEKLKTESAAKDTEIADLKKQLESLKKKAGKKADAAEQPNAEAAEQPKDETAGF